MKNLVYLLLLLVLFVFLIAYPFMLMWNYTLPSIFNVGEINFGQAICLLFLIGFLKAQYK